MSELASSPRSARDWLRRLYVWWLPVALGLTSLANLTLTVFLPPSAWPVRPHHEDSLTHLVHSEQPSVDRRFGFYLELGDATDGGELIVPPDSFVNPDLAQGFGDLEVSERDYDPTLLPEGVTDQPPLGEVETEDGNLSYSIIPGDGDDLWWLAYTEEGVVVVVPESVAPPPGAGP